MDRSDEQVAGPHGHGSESGCVNQKRASIAGIHDSPLRLTESISLLEEYCRQVGLR